MARTKLIADSGQRIKEIGMMRFNYRDGGGGVYCEICRHAHGYGTGKRTLFRCGHYRRTGSDCRTVRVGRFKLCDLFETPGTATTGKKAIKKSPPVSPMDTDCLKR
jgi:hypothetical protein